MLWDALGCALEMLSDVLGCSQMLSNSLGYFRMLWDAKNANSLVVGALGQSKWMPFESVSHFGVFSLRRFTYSSMVRLLKCVPEVC